MWDESKHPRDDNGQWTSGGPRPRRTIGDRLKTGAANVAFEAAFHADTAARLAHRGFRFARNPTVRNATHLATGIPAVDRALKGDD